MMRDVQSFSQQAWQNLNQRYGDGWSRSISLNRQTLIVEIETKRLLLQSIKDANPPPANVSEANIQRFWWGMRLIEAVASQLHQMEKGPVPESIKDDINLNILMIDRQIAAFSLEWQQSLDSDPVI